MYLRSYANFQHNSTFYFQYLYFRVVDKQRVRIKLQKFDIHRKFHPDCTFISETDKNTGVSE